LKSSFYSDSRVFINITMAFSPPPGKYEVFYDKSPYLTNIKFVEEGFTYFEEIHGSDCWCDSTKDRYMKWYGGLQDMYPSLCDGGFRGGAAPMYLVKCSNMKPDEKDTEEMRREWNAIVVGPIDLRKTKWKEFLEDCRSYGSFSSVDAIKKEGKEFKLV